ncbi:hypothetical protein OUZ56_002689 [Daphnia magna]|uniref:Uncharacterized protein n=1 Tax=Daphnia magna TaxID=35525 RepID=A0ABR0A6G8_9CRUS|nr:hypothetical protein OUZ56_002689 [Daphnia magna]
MQQPSIGGWSVALVALLFLLNAALITANQDGRCVSFERRCRIQIAAEHESDEHTIKINIFSTTNNVQAASALKPFLPFKLHTL